MTPDPAFEDDPVAMALGFTPVKPGVRLPGTPEHCHRCALDELAALKARRCDGCAEFVAAKYEGALHFCLYPSELGPGDDRRVAAFYPDHEGAGHMRVRADHACNAWTAREAQP